VKIINFYIKQKKTQENKKQKGKQTIITIDEDVQGNIWRWFETKKGS